MKNVFISKLAISDREKEFQEALQEYDQTGSKQAWDKIFYRVQDIAHNICAKMLVGVRLDPELFEERYMDATLYIMKRIREGLRPKKLSSYAYLVAKGRIHGKKAKFEDSIVYVDEFFPEVEKDASRDLSLESF